MVGYLFEYIDELLRLQSEAVDRYNHKGVLGDAREEFVHSEIKLRIDDLASRLHKGEIFCKDKMCFIKQGGLLKNIQFDFVSSLRQLNKTRNMLSHDKDYDKEMLQLHFNEIGFTCAKVNLHIGKVLKMSNDV